MNPKTPSLPFLQGGVSSHNSSAKASVQDTRWSWKNSLIGIRLKTLFFFLSMILVTTFSSFSQAIKESPSIFILQGTVKLKGKPVEGVSLELLKNEKQITKIVTRKNGMYSFQMDKSNTDVETEYILNIKKEGALPATLRINTYTTNEEFNYVPYVFNLEINLILPTASDIIVKHDFGKIKWDSEKGVFDFDKDYVSTVIKDTVKKDSSKFPLAVIGKIKKMAEEIKTTADEQAKQKTDDTKTQELVNENSAKVSTSKESEKTDDLKTQELVNENSAKISTMKESEKADDLKTQELVKENLAKISTMKEFEKVDVNITADEKTDAGSDKKKLALGNKKHEQSKAKTEVIDPKAPNLNQNTEVSVPKKKTNEMAELKKKENTSTLSNFKVTKVDRENKKEVSVNTVKLETNTEQLTIDNKQQRSTPPSAEINSNTFDGVSLFSTNNQKNKLLADKNKMERKKTENLSKKYETSNILTSLLDVVEEFEEK